jgi:peptide/nickel transport system substrate-binding protein
MKRLGLLIVLVLITSSLATCGPTPTPQVIEKITTQEVEKQVTQVVIQKETVIVPGTPQVVEKVVTATPEPPKGKVVVAVGVDPRSMNPLEDNVGHAMIVYHQFFDALFYRDQDLKLQPALGLSWKTLDDLTWEITLRQGVRFHNGEEFTADDVKFTFDWLTAPEQEGIGWAIYADPLVEKTEVVDDYTVRITTKEPAPLLISNLTDWHILPKDTFEEMGADAFRMNPVGTGPYTFVEWEKDDHLSGEAFEGYWGGVPSIKTVVFRPIPDAATRVAGLQTGELDLILNLSPERVPEINSDPNLQVKGVPGIRILFVAFNTREPPFDDVRLRQAVNYAVDKQAIIASVLGGRGYQRAATSSPPIAGYIEDLQPYPYDPEKAKELMAEAGYPDGFEFVFGAPRGRYQKDAEIAEAIAGQLAEVGITADLWIQEWSTFWERYLSPAKEKFGEGAFMAGFGNPALDGDQTWNFLNRCDSAGGYYCNEEVDKLILEERSLVTDTDHRLAVLQQIERKLYDDAAWLFLFNYEELYGMNKRLVWEPSSDDNGLRLFFASLKD